MYLLNIPFLNGCVIFVMIQLQCFPIVHSQIINRAPQFVPRSGDMSRFSLSENTPVGSPIYQLKGIDPEGGNIHYSISGPVFSVDRDSGVVRLRQALDRESQDMVEAIISITDEGILGTEPNTVSLRREIPIRDFNDNAPYFVGRPYTSSISEASAIGTELAVKPNIIVTDRDEGRNADINLSCFTELNVDSEVCETFSVDTDKITDGNFTASIKILKQLDFETRRSYILTLKAKDSALTNTLSALATVTINVLDVQDQPPVFSNPPYSATIPENTPEDTSVLTITATDGDIGNARPILLTIEDDVKGHFKLITDEKSNGTAELYTTGIPIDREDPDILQSGGVYSFTIKATELINNELPGDFTTTQITIVLIDVDDHFPEFNEQMIYIDVPENLEQDTPIPGLSLYVEDKDLGVNSRYNLTLKNVRNAKNVFTVSPTSGYSRTAVVIKVVDPTKLDYDVEDISLRQLQFDVIASVNGKPLTMSRITLNLQDANDNSPEFSQTNYVSKIEENSKVGTKIMSIMATDKDSGTNGRIKYVLRGFGSDYFSTDPDNGGLYVNRNLDYEQQKSYSLSIVAIDGGGRETNANIYVNINDVNDNYPTFESLEYTRIVREGATEFEPLLLVRAIDLDGPVQGGGKIRYKIESDNSISGNIFKINEESGEIIINQPVSSMDTERGQYELSISATDYGTPPLKNTTRVIIRVGISGNQRPVFKGQFMDSNRNSAIGIGPPIYRATIPENAKSGYNITTISATDPDGIDALLTYRLVGANDNFIIDDRSGLVKVSTVARLDRDSNPDHYSLVINAVDAGFPIPETATTTLYINVKDVNDKPPRFIHPTYTAYISERSVIGSEVVTVLATDSDLNSNLTYEIIKYVKAISKTGTELLSSATYDYRSAIIIDKKSGKISVNGSLNHDLAAVIILTVKATDNNAEYNVDKQFATADVTIYVQSFKDTNPIFKNAGWTNMQQVINVRIKEEMPIGDTIFILDAEDPLQNHPIQTFEFVQKDSHNYFGMNDRTGEIMLKKRLDYENLNDTNVQFMVKAVSHDGRRHTLTMVNVTIDNVNDNSPMFEQQKYRKTIIENTKYPGKVLTVYATDQDSVRNDGDQLNGYHTIVYSLFKGDIEYFTINNVTGEINIAKGQVIDREKQPTLSFMVLAADSPSHPSESRSATAEIFVEILDVNDNAPVFTRKVYSAVIPENAKIDTSVINITASDPDDGPGGDVRYDLLNEGDANSLLKINARTGEIKTKMPLTGKGRSEPYELVIRGQDNGNQVPKQKSLHSDVNLILYIGDVSANDGIPYFVAPKIGQIANISENATIGSPVFQVVASDPDSPLSNSGKLSFKILEDTEDSKAFRIDSETGLITTLKSLDRETKSSYNLIVEATDMGQPPQAVTRILHINVLDIDDHKPRFIREADAQPIRMETLEEQRIGTEIGILSAVDEDIDENGSIDYMFIDGNQEDLFDLERTDNNSAIIKMVQRLDREQASTYILTIKCFKFGTKRSQISRKSYDPYDLSEIQIHINIIDIDDHLPEFEIINPIIGIRLNVPINQPLITVTATDKDPDAVPINYRIEKIKFVPQFYRRENSTFENLFELFHLNNDTARLKTASNRLADYVDGYFEITIRANNSESSKRFINNIVKIFVMRDKSLLRFVFNKPPTEIKPVITEFSNRVQRKINQSNLELYILDTQVLTRHDLSLDFTSTSSCFQLSRHGSALSPHEMHEIMDSKEVREALLEIYSQYSVNAIESCSVRQALATSALITSPGTWLVILAVFIGIFALVATFSACCLTLRYRKESRLLISPHTVPKSYGVGTSVMYSEPIYGPFHESVDIQQY